MAFVNEPVSDADIDRYGLPFAKGSGRWWTRDAERDYYLWGGKGGNPAFGQPFEGRFNLCIDSKHLCIGIEPEDGSYKVSDVPFYVRWGRVKYISPSDCHDLDRDFVLSVLREALAVYGIEGRSEERAIPVCVTFDF